MKPRALKFDLIRITAICMVLFIHVTVVLVLFYHDATFTVANVFNGLGRAGVPMFLLLSGALLLDEDRPFDTKKFYRTSFFSIALLLVGWLLFYASWRAFLLPLLRGKPTDPKHFVTYLLTLKGLYPHLWYLFMLVGAYLAVPFLRLFVKKENKPYILGFILLSVIVGFGATTFGVFTRDADVTVGLFLTKFHFEYATGYLPYLLIGWYLTTFPPKKAMRFVLYGPGLAAALICVFGVQAWVKDIPDIRDYLVEATTLPALLYGVGLFTLISALTGEQETKSLVIRELSRVVWGVYPARRCARCACGHPAALQGVRRAVPALVHSDAVYPDGNRIPDRRSASLQGEGRSEDFPLLSFADRRTLSACICLSGRTERSRPRASGLTDGG